MFRVGILAALVLAWLGAAAVLWRTEVPDALQLPQVDASRYFAPGELAEHERHDRVLRTLGMAALVAELVGLFAVARRPPRVRGPLVAKAAQLGLVALVAAFLARLPFALAILWWQRDAGIARVGYLRWLLDRLPELGLRGLVLAAAAAVAVALARRLGARWWLAGAPLFVATAVAVVVFQPLLTPRVDQLERPRLTAQIRALGAQLGLDDVEVEVRDARSRSRQLNAEALGVGPTTRVILWDTTLELPRGVVLFLSSHELAHVSRDHLWKGLTWFVLLAVPLTAVLARVVDLRDPSAVPRAVLLGALLALAITPFVSAISRRYEAEADWVALRTTRDPASAAQLFVAMAQAGLRDPSPPRLYTFFFGTHPTLLDRIAMAEAFRRDRAGPSRGGS